MLALLSFVCLLFVPSARPHSFSFDLEGREEAVDFPVKKTNKLEPLADVFGQPVDAALYNMRYYDQTGVLEADVSVGTPPKVFSVIVDSGSTTLWLPAVGCATDGAGNRELCAQRAQLFDPAASRTAKRVGGAFGINYGVTGDTSATRGVFYSDYFAFGNANSSLRLRQPVVFGAADFVVRLERGILGLGIPVAGQVGTSIFDAAVREGALDSPQFTLFFRRCPAGRARCPNAGVLTLGARDERNCGGVEATAAALPFGGPWQFALDALAVGGFRFAGRARATADSGSPLLHLPRPVVDGIVRELGAWREGHYFAVDCRRPFAIQLTIGGQTLSIPKEEVTYDLDGRRCLLNVQAIDADDLWLLGAPLLRSYCHVHDWTRRTIGFARVKM
ncbi:Eukaryotic aspartyl protease [Aphelenchoides fujianensis]|nr:Eukaryotic aspartyl protease [Aphelenchoides fujianensis]